MDDWLDQLADALNVRRLAPDELGTILKLAREVAHGTERRFAPASTFLAGVAVGIWTAGGRDRERSIADAVRTAREVIPEGPGDG
jgi:hypothetical protein